MYSGLMKCGWVCACMHAFLCVCTHAFVWACVCIYACMCVCTREHVCVSEWVYVCGRAHVTRKKELIFTALWLVSLARFLFLMVMLLALCVIYLKLVIAQHLPHIMHTTKSPCSWTLIWQRVTTIFDTQHFFGAWTFVQGTMYLAQILKSYWYFLKIENLFAVRRCSILILSVHVCCPQVSVWADAIKKI